MIFNLGKRWESFIKDHVREGRYQNQSEVVRAALRLLEENDMEEFRAAFPDLGGAPRGEPSPKDMAEIDRAVRKYRANRRTRRAA